MNPMNRLRPNSPAEQGPEGSAPAVRRHQRRRARPAWRATARSMVVLALAASLLAPLPAAAQQEPNDEPDDQTAIEPETTEPPTTEPAVTAPAAPVFTDGASVTLTIAEDHADGASVGFAAATDADSDTLTYSLSGTDAASFALDPATGEITVASGVTLDFETQSTHSVTVGVSDGIDADGNPETGAPVVDATIEVTIEVTDVTEAEPSNEGETGNEDETENDEAQPCNGEQTSGLVSSIAPTAPVFTAGASVTLTVSEDHAEGASVGFVEATDANGDTLVYSLSGTDAASFELDTATGEICVAAGVSLDFETQSSHSVIVGVSDGIDADGNPETGAPAADAAIEVTVEVTDAPEDQAGTDEETGNDAADGALGQLGQGAQDGARSAQSDGPTGATEPDLPSDCAPADSDDSTWGGSAISSSTSITVNYPANVAGEMSSWTPILCAKTGTDAQNNDVFEVRTVKIISSSDAGSAGSFEITKHGTEPADAALTPETDYWVSAEYYSSVTNTARTKQWLYIKTKATTATESTLPMGCTADGTETNDWFQSVTATATLIVLEWTDPFPANVTSGNSGLTVCAPTGALDNDGNPIYESHVTYFAAFTDVGTFSMHSYASKTGNLLSPDTVYWLRPQSGYGTSSRAWPSFKVRTQAGTATPPLGCGGRVHSSDEHDNISHQRITSLSAAGQTIKVGFDYGDEGSLPASVSLDLCNGAGEIATIDSDITRSGTDRVVSGEVTITQADFTDNSTEDPTSLAENTDYWVRTKIGTGYVWHYMRTGAATTEPADPVFADGGSTTLTVAEDLAAGGSVGTVGAADANGDTLVYSLSGTDASSFTLNTSTGEISLAAGATLDYETKSSYSVTVGVKDNKDSSGNDAPSEGNDATIAVTINVTNVEEPPGTPTALSVDAMSVTSLTLGWTAPSHGANLPPITGYDVRYFQGSSDPSDAADWIEPGETGSHSHTGTGTTTEVMGLSPGSNYRFQVRAKGDGNGPWSSSASGMTDQNSVTLSWSPSSAAEPATATDVSVTVTATIAAARNANTTVNLEFAGGTATSGTDYTLTGAPSSVTIPANQTSVTSAAFTMRILPDNVDESAGETVIVRLMGTHWATINEGTFTILDQPKITLSLEDTGGNALSSLSEAAGSTQVRVKASRDLAASSGAVTVTLARASSSTATHGTHYTGTSNLGSISLGANAATGTRTITIDPQEDVNSVSETIVIGGSAGGHTVSTATLTLNDNDSPSDTITLTVNPLAVSETTGAKTVRVFAAVNGAAVTAPTTVTLSLDETNSTATKGTDYSDPGSLGTIVLGTGLVTASKTINITPIADTLDEGAGETIVITATTDNSAITTVNDATLTIDDNDPTPTAINLTATPSSVNEADAGTAQQITVKAALVGPSTRTVATVVKLGSISGTATKGAASGNDYTLSTALSDTSITIPAGASESTANVTFGVTPIQDSDSEGPETITLGGSACLSTPMMGADCPDADVLTVNDAVVTLVDDDLPVITLTLEDAGGSALSSLAETAASTQVRVKATRDSSATSGAAVVTLKRDASSTAVHGTDYAGTADANLPMITLADGMTSATATITIDPTDDADSVSEQLVIGGTATGYSVSTATLTFNDLDTPSTSVTITAKTSGDATEVSESATGTRTVTVTATLDGGTLGDHVIVTFGALGGTATRGADTSTGDYTSTPAKPAAVTISANSQSASTTITIDPRGDTLDEGNGETIVFDATLSGGLTGTGAGKVTPATFTIRDDDDTPTTVVLSVDTSTDDSNKTTLGEGDGATTVTVKATLAGSSTRTSPTAVDVTVVSVATDGATPSADATSDDYRLTNFADNNADLTAVTLPISLGSISIPAGDSSASKTFRITPNDDSDNEPDETIRVDGSATGLIVNHADITLVDNDLPLLTLLKNISQVSEADLSGKQVTVSATVAEAVSQAVTVPLTFAGTAIRGTDYTVSVASPSITIASGSSVGFTQFTLTRIQDRLTEGDETILISGTSASYDVGTLTITLKDDDAASNSVLLTLFAADGTTELTGLGEPDGNTTVTVTAELNDGTLSSPVTVTFADLRGTATRGTDYAVTNASGTAVTKPAALTIAAGSVTASTTIKIDPVDDILDEGNSERIDFTATLGGALSGSASKTLTIRDNDTAQHTVNLTVSPTAVSEGHSGAREVTVTATVPGPAAHATDTVVPVQVVTTPASKRAATPSASASSGDYRLTNFADNNANLTNVSLPISLGSITIDAGSRTASRTFKIDPRDDTDFEGTHADRHEYIRIGAGAVSGFTIDGTDLRITENDDPGITITVDTSGDSGTQTNLPESAGQRNVSVTLTMDHGARSSATDVAISFAGAATRGACSTAGTDYSAGTRSVQIGANQTSRTFTLPITVCDDRVTETGGETFVINGTATDFDVTGATVTIDDNDTESTSLTISAAVTPALAEADGARTVTVTATLDGGTVDKDVTVTFSALGGNAMRGANTSTGDYTSNPAKPSSITLPKDSLSAQTTISIDPRDDTIDEKTADETIVFGGTAAKMGGGTLSVNPGTLTITDNDTAAVTIAVDTNASQTGTPTAVGEGAGATTVRVSATLSTTRSTATDVTLRIDGGSADRGSDKDYTASSSLTDTTVDITIAAGSTSGFKDVEITPVEDRFDDDDETVVIGAAVTDSLAVTAGTVTITDNDDPSTIIALTVDTDTGTMGDQHSIGEGAGATSVVVTATLNDAVRAGPTTVTLTFAGSAVRGAGGDYDASGTLSVVIPANAVSGSETITIAPTEEKVDDGDKTIAIGGTVTVSGLAVTAAPDVTLADNDDAPTQIKLTVDPETVREQGPAGQSSLDTTVRVTASFTGTNADVTLLNDTSVTVTVHSSSTAQRSTSTAKPTTSSGWATGDQYWAPAALGDSTVDITIAAGETLADTTFVFTSRNENINDNDKTIVIDGAATGFTFGAANRATIDFTDNDGPSTSITLTAATISCNHHGPGMHVYGVVNRLREGVTAPTSCDDSTVGAGLPLYFQAELDGSASVDNITVALKILSESESSPPPGRTYATRGFSGDYTAADTLGDPQNTADITILANTRSSGWVGPFWFTPFVDNVDDGAEVSDPSNELIRVGGTASASAITTVRHVDLEILDYETASDRISLSREAGRENLDEDHGAGEVYTIRATLAGSVARSEDTAMTLGLGGTAALGADCATDGVDYTASPSPAVVTIAAEALTGEIDVTVTPCDDDASEGNETIRFDSSLAGFNVTGAFDVNLVDDELPVITVSSRRLSPASDDPDADSSVEEGETARFEITATRLVARAASRVELPLSVQDASTATPGDDYTALAAKLGTIVIPEGEASATRAVTVQVRTREDRVREGGETIVIGGVAGDGTEYSVTPATITIADDDGPSDGFELTVNRRSISEAAGATEVTVTAEVNMGAPTAEVTVTLGFGGVATKGTDYTDPGTVTLTIPANELRGSVTFEIDPTEDLLDEGRGETIEIGVASATGLETALDPAKVTPAELTITDNDTASSVVTLTVDNTEMAEAASDAIYTVTASLGGTVVRGDDTVVTLELGGTAVLGRTSIHIGADYGWFNRTPTVTIPAGALKATVALQLDPFGDRVREPTETIRVGGTAVARDVTLRVVPATISIIDDDDDPSTRVTLRLVRPSNGAVTEADGIREVRVIASLDAAARTADTVVWLDLGGTATAGDDYRVWAPQPVLVEIQAGQTHGSATLLIDPIDDHVDEGVNTAAEAETITVSGRDARVSGLEVWLDGDTETVKQEHLDTGITITDNDSTSSNNIALSVDTARLREGGPGAAVQVTATLGGTVARGLDTVVALTALPDDPDGWRHSGLPASVTIPAGSLSGSASGLRITPTQDFDAANETITLGGTETGFTVSPATITVIDDDVASTSLTLSVSPSSLRESSGRRTVRVTATLDGGTRATPTTLTLNVDDTNSTADRATDPENPADGDDYSGLLGALGDGFVDITIEPGRRSGTSEPFTIELLDDTIDEGDETIIFGGATVPALTVHGATLTIADDDTASDLIDLSVDTDTVNEKGGAVTVTLTATLRGTVARAVPTTVTLTTAGSAQRGGSGHYTLGTGEPGTLEIAAGEFTAAKTITVTPGAIFLNWTIDIEGTAPAMRVAGATIFLNEVDLTSADPAHPTITSVTPANSVRVRWDAGTPPENSYEVQRFLLQRRTLGGRWHDAAAIAPEQRSYVDGPLDRAESYQWRLFAVGFDPTGDRNDLILSQPSEAWDPSVSRPSTPPSGGGFVGGGGGGGFVGGGGGSADDEEDECTGETSRYTFILANGWSAADISVAAALAARTPYAVVLYSSSDELPRHVESLICEHQPRSVTVIGGSEALSGAVVRQVRDAAADTDIDRLRGATRIETAAAVARAVLGDPAAEASSATGSTLVIANGWSAPDAGAAAAIAARTPNSAVLYTASGALPDATRDVIVDYQPARIVIVGGTTAVSEAAEQAIAEAAGAAPDADGAPGDAANGADGAADDGADGAEAAAADVVIERVMGATRTDTAAAAARLVLGDLAKAARRTFVVVNGWSPPDIGVAAALAARSSNTAVLYSTPDVLDDATRDVIAGYKPSRIIIVGGPTAVPQAVSDAIAKAAPGAAVERVTGATRTHTAANAANRTLG